MKGIWLLFFESLIYSVWQAVLVLFCQYLPNEKLDESTVVTYSGLASYAFNGRKSTDFLEFEHLLTLR